MTRNQQVSDESATAASTADLAQAAGSTVVDHDRPVTATGDGRIRFKGHSAKGGYPYRVFDGHVQALVEGAWVEAEDATRLED